MKLKLLRCRIMVTIINFKCLNNDTTKYVFKKVMLDLGTLKSS